MKRSLLLFLFLILSLIFSPAHAQVNFPPLFGIQDDEMTWDPLLRPKSGEIGARWVRQYLFWDHIEPNSPSGTPQYNWNLYDSLFLEYKNLGLTPIVIIGGIPSWAAPNPYGPFYTGRMEDFKRFIRDLVERYDGDGVDDAPGSPVVNFFEFFNEPDLISTTYAGPGWGYWSSSGGGSGAGYEQMLQSIYFEVKASNPNAMVVLGGLALEDTPYFNFNFFDELLIAGGGNYFDVMNFHYYTALEGNWRTYGKDILGKTNYVHNRLLNYRLTKPIIVTETGEWSSELTECAWDYQRNEEIQARYVPKLYVRSLTDASIKAVVWFVLEDKSEWDPCNGTRGLFSENGPPKPAYYAYRTASDLLRSATFQETFGNIYGYEGYQFFVGGTSFIYYIYALWNDTGPQWVSLAISSNQVIKMDKLGNQQTLYPTSPGRFDITIGPDPFYLIFSETAAETITAPSTPTGATAGLTGESFTYSTGDAVSNVQDPVQYLFDWGDGTNSGWLPVGITSATKAWTNPGVYAVKAQARCATHTFVLSEWSSSRTVTISNPPPTPETVTSPSQPSGSGTGEAGTTYTYSADGSSSNQSDPVQYLIDWGDGTNSGWLDVGTTSAQKSWSSSGVYTVRTRARCAVHTYVLSGWSSNFPVSISAPPPTPETVTTPSTPTGTTDGQVGVIFPYFTADSSSNLGDPVQYLFDWGDGSNSGWLPTGTTSATKSWAYPGVYAVRAQARCATHTFVQSAWSSGRIVTISPPPETISTPTTPVGQASGYTHASYSYTTGGSTSNLGHTVEYQFDWQGDASNLSSWGSATQSKSWSVAGTYYVRARARCITDTSVVSDWSSPFEVVLSISDEVVSIPATPGGPTGGSINTPYSYTTSGSSSNLGHTVEYQFDWEGDSSDLSPWGSATRSKTWNTSGTYFVRVRARCSQDQSVVSYWSPTLTIRILAPPPAVDNPPLGSFDIPLPDSTISGVVQVGGWALDDVGIAKIELRSDIPFWPYLGDLYYTCGTRPDIVAAFPNYPNNDCAGWGYMWLTNSMSETIDPQTGQRLDGATYRFYLRIYDTAGHSVDVGHRYLTLRNDTNLQPFGAMDIPWAGEIVSGPINVMGWSLAKGGRRITQAQVRLDGVVVGQANYGLHWPDLAQMFPISEYPYSEDAAYAYSLDTTSYTNGQHALDVVVVDEIGTLAGIGSRYIYIQN